jgi:serine/threonine protein kinase
LERQEKNVEAGPRLKAADPRISQIEILEVISRGSMSSVYKAKQTLLDRIVAVKVLAAGRVNDEKSQARFLKEARLTAALDHPNIARSLGSGISEDGLPYLVIEYIEGCTLAQQLENRVPMTFGRFRQIFLPLLAALEYAHAAGLIHRDIKPVNIMLELADGKETVKLLDFGVAALSGQEQKGCQQLTQEGALIGSPAYMSPEQCLGSEVDRRADIYSLACVMYEALCGKPLFEGSSDMAVMGAHVSAKLPSTSELSRRLKLPEALCRLILSALSKKPDKRPATAAEFAAGLQKALDEVTLERIPGQQGAASVNKASPPLIIFTLLAVAMLLFFAWRFRLKNENQVGTAGVTAKISRPDLDGLTTSQLEDRAGKYFKLQKNADELACWEKSIEIMSTVKHRPAPVYMFVRAACCALGAGKSETDKNVAALYFKKSIAYVDQTMPLAIKEQDKGDYLQLCGTKLQVLELQQKIPELLRFSGAMLAQSRSPSFDECMRLQVLLQVVPGIFAESKPDEARRLLEEAVSKTNSDSTVEAQLILRLKFQLVRIYKRSGQTKKALALARASANALVESEGIKPSNRIEVFSDMMNTMADFDENLIFQTVLRDLQKHDLIYRDDPGTLSRTELILVELCKRQNLSGKSMEYLKSALQHAEVEPANLSLRQDILQNLIDLCTRNHDLSAAAVYRQKLEKLNAEL